MKKLIFIILLFLSIRGAFANEVPKFYQGTISYLDIPTINIFDDTYNLQQLLNAGAVTLPASHAPYHVSSTLYIYHSLNLNGDTIEVSQTTGAALRINLGGSITNGALIGPWDYTTLPNTSGTTGIVMQGAGTSITYLHISSFASYGINTGVYNNITVDHNLVEKTGYVGFYFDSEVNGISGLIFTNNTIDRSALSPLTILDACVDIRGSVSNSSLIATNCTITGNTFLMPFKPHLSSNECMELRNVTRSTVSNNICSQGSIGLSIIQCSFINILNNKCTGQSSESIELGDLLDSKISNNSSKNSVGDGILFDGKITYDRRDTLLNDTVKGTTLVPVNILNNTKHIVFTGGYYYGSSGGKCINLRTSDSISFSGVAINGRGLSSGIFLDTAPGNITITGGTIDSCTSSIQAYNTQTNSIVDYIQGTGVSITHTSTQFGGVFSNGAKYGTHNFFISNSLIFGAISSKNYGNVDFSPGATSSNPIIYTSSNLSVCTIIAGNIHITGTGSSTITANDGSTSLTQSVTINKTSLVITANNKSKNQGDVNPTLTASYSGFQYLETNSVLTAQPILSTSAITSSAAGNYSITVSGASASNYNISYISGTLTINAPTDNTATLQALINSGVTTLSNGTTYNISSLNIVNTLHLNGAKLNVTGSGLNMNTSGKTIDGGELIGQSNISNSNGNSGVQINASSCIISHIYIHNFPNSGVTIGTFNNPTINDCRITNTGYSGISYLVATASNGLIALRDTVDRSSVSSGINLQISGLIGQLISNCTIRHCIFIQSNNPSDTTAKGIQLKYVILSKVDSNSFNYGSVGLSEISSTRVSSTLNLYNGQNLEAISLSSQSKDINGVITNQLQYGYLVNNSTDTISNPTISGCRNHSIHCIGNTLTVTSGIITSFIATPSIYFLKSSGNNISGTILNGNSIGTYAFLLDNSTGNFKSIGCNITNFTGSVLSIFGNSYVFTDAINITASLGGISSNVNTSLSNGACVGTNIHINGSNPFDKFVGGYVHFTSPVTLTGIHDTTITGNWYSTLNLSSCNRVTFVNCLFGSVATSSLDGISTTSCFGITIKNCYFKNTARGVYSYYSSSIKVDSNQFSNMQGSSTGKGYAVEFYHTNGGSISYNKMENIDGSSSPQYSIYLFASNGTSSSPIQINNNMIRCGYPTSLIGGGISLGDNQGSYITCQYNSMVNPGAYGLSILGGTFILANQNKIYSSKNPNSNISYYSINFSNTTPSLGNCISNNIYGNIINWYSNRNKNSTSNYYAPGSCTILSGNTYGASINATIIPTVIITTSNPIH